ncbi:hypothetical protein [uncultured Parabacteroides sp.]|uniref:hypothetical protein n=1 Tax=uncultured Parabacteroides sp. TaxID=512312 RepID=UPI0025F3DEA0|nr:hypothetical protein [uncultured Parabacteroides sp.]
MTFAVKGSSFTLEFILKNDLISYVFDKTAGRHKLFRRGLLPEIVFAKVFLAFGKALPLRRQGRAT